MCNDSELFICLFDWKQIGFNFLHGSDPFHPSFSGPGCRARSPLPLHTIGWLNDCKLFINATEKSDTNEKRTHKIN